MQKITKLNIYKKNQNVKSRNVVVFILTIYNYNIVYKIVFFIIFFCLVNVLSTFNFPWSHSLKKSIVRHVLQQWEWYYENTWKCFQSRQSTAVRNMTTTESWNCKRIFFNLFCIDNMWLLFICQRLAFRHVVNQILAMCNTAKGY